MVTYLQWQSPWITPSLTGLDRRPEAASFPSRSPHTNRVPLKHGETRPPTVARLIPNMMPGVGKTMCHDDNCGNASSQNLSLHRFR